MPNDQARLKSDMRAAVAALPELERSAFRLCAVDGMDYPAIAERLGIGVDEVERLLASALVRLGRDLGAGGR
ncbi:hypothetical protein NDN01_20405 [Sphingomonas sp. QA11]|uniref:RNA polymerase sigma factor n=1 Tax=Sphingomonas sp. QA11 TaxID=2950605 RepID=UPI002349BE49|nr:sigma factor-like helix-turn-helix DNA-binding protein [Sphingomonas sp. QA11]WCM26344.1 hypothetical protein NDN01_20405 [Sphingomonas sp. QA11]